jgi:hypothetical protein
MSPRRRLLLAALALGLLGTLPEATSAEVLRLKTGETIKGRVVPEKSREDVLVVEDYATGALREIAWKALVERDSERWLENLGIEDKKGPLEIECESITYRVGGGTDVVNGVVEREDDATIHVRTAGRVVPIEKSRVVSREKGTCDATELFTPEELHARKMSEVNPTDARGWFRVAKFDEKIGAYAEAKTAYENAAADAEFLYAEQARAKVTQLTALLKDKEAFDALRDLKVKLSSKQFARVREGLERFPEAHPEAGEAVKKAVEGLKEQFKRDREKALAKAAGDAYVKIVRKLVRLRVKDKEVKINDVLSWTKKSLTEEAMAELAGKSYLGRLDPVVTPEEARTLWDARPKRDWKRASYGAGTFVVEPPKIKPPSNRGGGGNRRPQGGPAVQIDIPKPPTRDSWWEKESSEKREEWIVAHYAETSGLFEVHPKKDKTSCDPCVGTGLMRRALSGGGELVFLCTRCGGAQVDLTVKFR